MLLNSFHLSFEVTDIHVSKLFYTKVLGGSIEKDTGDWCNINLFNHQITLHHNPKIAPQSLINFHWGLNVVWPDFDLICQRLIAIEAPFVKLPEIQHLGQSSERVKMAFKDPSGYVIEIKSYRNFPTVF
jgi:extradiol dioxygenase family protein